METNKLMLGDYITFRDVQNDSYCPKVKVCGLIDDDVYASIDGDPVLDVVDPDELAGIPLTKEILEKNGFQRSETESTSLAENWRWHEKVTGRVYNRYVEITFYKEPIIGVSHLTEIETCSQKGDGVNKIHSCDIDYIHELQHALRICGIEKEINVN